MDVFKIEKNKSYFIFHISSAEVLGSIVSYDFESKKPKIVFFTKKKIEFNKNLESDIFKKNTENALEKVCQSLEDYLSILGQEVIDRAFVFLTSPWVKKNIFTLNDERISPFKVNEKYLKEIIDNAGSIKDNETLLKVDIMSIKANGYNVTLPDLIDKKVSKLEISLLDTVLKKRMEKGLDGVIGSKFPFLETTFLGFLPTFFNQIQKIYNTDSDFAFLDFSGEYSDFGLFIDNKIEVLSAYPIGINKILRILVVEKIAKNFDQAEYLFDLYLKKRLDEDVSLKIKNVVDKESGSLREFIKKVSGGKMEIDLIGDIFVFTPSFKTQVIVKDLKIFKNLIFIDKLFLKDFVFVEDEKYFNNFIALEGQYIFDVF